jgi:hypothetical protein
MPEIHPLKRLRSWTVRAAAAQGQVIVVTCDFCRVTHNYLPGDLETLCGNLSLDRLLGRFKCEGCGKKIYLRMTLHIPHGSEFGSMEIRRLTRVRTLIVPVWSEDVLR